MNSDLLDIRITFELREADGITMQLDTIPGGVRVSRVEG